MENIKYSSLTCITKSLTMDSGNPTGRVEIKYNGDFND